MDRLKDLLDQDQEKDMVGVKERVQPDFSEIEVFAYTVEEALKTAAEELNTSIVNLEYEILERGQGGLFGLGKKPNKILVRLSQGNSNKEQIPMEALDYAFEEPSISINQDGKFKVTVTREGVLLKIDPPNGGGKAVSFHDIQVHLLGREIIKFNENAVKKEIEAPGGKYVKIAEYSASQYDSKFQIQISPDEMKTYMTMTKPEKYGRVISPDEVISVLKSKNVYFGVKESTIKDAIENELYNMPIIIAEGDPPYEGKDSQIKYHFKTGKDEVKFEIAEDGSVDFHKLDIVQSVVVGQVVASKSPAERGKAGKTITGRVIPARDGRDLKLSNGNNTHLSPDGTQIIADINGQVLFKNNKIQIEPVYEVNGDVDLTTGDINFPGNIIIYGNVNDTFKVYSGANIEIKGNIGKSRVVAEGNIIIRQGVQGKDEANILCAGDLYAKFIERANIKAEGYIIVSEYILHSNVDCKKKIICQGGKRSQIAGGRARALLEINAKYLGAESYTETLIEAGIDSEAEDKFAEIHKRKDEIAKAWPDILQQLSNLSGLMTTGPLPLDKQELFNNLSLKNNEFKQEMAALDEQIRQLQAYIDGLGKDAKIAASKTVYPGVKIKIKNEILIVKNDYKFVTFYKEGAYVKVAPYEQTKEMEEKMKEGSRSRKL